MLATYDDLANKTMLPESIMPVQFFQRPSHAPPAQALLIAVLDSGISDILAFHGAKSRRNTRLYDEAWSWLHSEETTWLYSFRNICRELDLDAGQIRHRLATVLATHTPTEKYTRPSQNGCVRRRAWIRRDPHKHGWHVYLRRGLDIFHLDRFATKPEANFYAMWARRNMLTAIQGRTPTERLN